MRLLQLATGTNELLDLHPNITIVTGLDDPARRLLIEAVTGLARGTTTGSNALLEAHGVLFDLSPEVLALLDIVAGDLEPVVSADDVPLGGSDPLARERIAAERALAAITQRWEAARSAVASAQGDVAAAAHAHDLARRASAAAESDAANRMASIELLTSQLEHAVEQRRHLGEDLAGLRSRRAGAAARRAEVEAATAAVREERQQALARCAGLAARIDQESTALAPEAAAEAEQATQELARVEAEVEAEREAERRAAAEAAASDEETPAARLERVERRIGELERHLAAFAPTEVEAVSASLERVTSQGEDQVPMPEALALAEELEALEAELVASSGVERVPGGLAESRIRLDDARQALLEAEQAARNPEVDRALVDRLETTHAELLDAMDKAEGRLGGARAQRKVDALRSVEDAILEEMGFGSYADYMMGYSLLHTDPAKEEALDAARLEIAAAEDAWNELQAETEAELARAELMERRRLGIERARELIGRPVPTGSVVRELQELRVPANTHDELTTALRRALEDVGLALGDDELDREELVLVAETWLTEAGDAVTREQEVRAELQALAEERTAALAAVQAEVVDSGPTAEELRERRVVAARQQARAAEERRRSHLEAEARVEALARELAAATQAERIATEAAGDADAMVDATASEEEALAAEISRIEEDLAAAGRAEGERDTQLRELRQAEDASSFAPVDTVGQAEAAGVAAEETLVEAQRTLGDLDRRRVEAIAALEALPVSGTEVVEESSVVEEIEWYLLARLAAQRHRSLGGSLPLLLDDALHGLDEDELSSVLGRLERMAEAVQVIVVTDDPLASSWAFLAGADRAAVVQPQPA